LHLVGILFPHINDDAWSKSHQSFFMIEQQVYINIFCGEPKCLCFNRRTNNHWKTAQCTCVH